ncbi:MAG: hypothetical protein AAGI30_03150 [Planctomycetota bacterium]
MAHESISFDEAEKLIQQHGLGIVRDHPEVDGIGIAPRNGELRFIVGVENEAAIEKLQGVLGTHVAGFPVHIEIVEMVSVATMEIDGDDTTYDDDFDELTPASPKAWVAELIDRPGFIGVAAVLVVAVVAVFIAS